MAERRMFSKQVVESDAFLSLPLSAQALYVHLSMSADDEGFVNSPERIRRYVGAKQSDIDALIDMRFIIVFSSGVVVIKHWFINNYLRSDRIKETVYQEEKAQLIKQDNGRYSLLTCGNTDMTDKCQSDVSQMSVKCQASIDKYSIDEYRIDKSSRCFAPPTREEVADYIKEKGYYIEPDRFIDYYTAQGWKLSNGRSMKDWKAAVRNWHHRDQKKGGEIRGKYAKYANAF